MCLLQCQRVLSGLRRLGLVPGQCSLGLVPGLRGQRVDDVLLTTPMVAGRGPGSPTRHWWYPGFPRIDLREPRAHDEHGDEYGEDNADDPW